MHKNREMHCTEQCYFLWAGEGMVLGATILGGTKIAEGMATSTNPWAYLAGILLVALIAIGFYTLKWLVKLDTTHRDESAKREERVNDQLDKSIAASSNIVETQKEMIVAITGVQTAISGVQGELHMMKSDTNERLSKLEQIVKRESA